MFEPIPEPSLTSDYLKIREGEKHRIRIMGTSKDPATFIQGWEAWDQDNKPHREPYELGKPCSRELKDIDRNANPKLFWMFTVFHVDEERAKVFAVTQRTIKDPILAYAKNPKWGDPRSYIIEIGRTGSGMETEYTVIAEPPIEPPDQKIIDVMNEAAIDLRVIFDDGNPFGALTNDQENIKEVKKSVKIESDGGGINKPVSAMDVLGRMRDNAPPGPDEETAPPMGDGEPY
tara:strand:- start:49 stop:744 length:696 start_codon:yes stop_codon:yes gene_type:complete